MCRHEAVGAERTKKDRNGAPYHLHRLDGSARPPVDQPPPSTNGTPPDRADADTLHKVYSALLTRLFLSPAHRKNLQDRGLTDAQIDSRGYKTWTFHYGFSTARELHKQFCDSVLKVPGFIMKEGRNGRFLTLAGPEGIVVPVRDLAGRIVALQIRRDVVTDGSKYVYLSSTKYDGPSPGSPVHVPLGIVKPVEKVRVTEGFLKPIPFAECLKANGEGNFSAQGSHLSLNST